MLRGLPILSHCSPQFYRGWLLNRRLEKCWDCADVVRTLRWPPLLRRGGTAYTLFGAAASRTVFPELQTCAAEDTGVGLDY